MYKLEKQTNTVTVKFFTYETAKVSRILKNIHMIQRENREKNLIEIQKCGLQNSDLEEVFLKLCTRATSDQQAAINPLPLPVPGSDDEQYDEQDPADSL